METITIPKKDFDKILKDMEVLLNHVEGSLDKKAKKRLNEVNYPTVAPFLVNVFLKNCSRATGHEFVAS